MSDEKDKRPRSPNFPYETLRESIVLVQKLYESDKQNYVPMKIALNHMGLSVNSSTSRRVVSAMLEYGLLEDRGEGDDKDLIVSDLARNILLDKRPNSTDKMNNIREAALNSKIMHEAWDKWKGEIPSDETIRYILISKWGFTDRAATRFTKVVQDNFQYAELDDYYEVASEENSVPVQQTLYDPKMQQGKQQKFGDQKPQLNVSPNWLDFNLSLGADQHARLLVSNSLSEDDFEFLLIWIKRLKNDIVENNKENKDNDNDDDISF